MNFEPSLVLANGVAMPQVGLGTFRSAGDDAYRAVLTALKAGYRHIDTAAMYQNEEEVGRAIRDSGVPRQEIFVTTKVYGTEMGYDKTLASFANSLKKLGLTYLDLFLIHWPSSDAVNRDTWRAMETLYQQKKVRAIGVCNFLIHHFEHLFPSCHIKPMVNQIELHPQLQQINMRAFAAEHKMVVTSYGPLIKGDALQIPELKALAEKYHKSVANIVVRWGLQNGVIMIPKSITPDRIVDNLKVFDFVLSEEDMQIIRKLNKGRKVYPDPDNRDF